MASPNPEPEPPAPLQKRSKARLRSSALRPRPLVDDVQLDPVAGGFGRNRDVRTGLRGGQRVGDEIVEHLVKPLA